jgi:hypothetical protein
MATPNIIYLYPDNTQVIEIEGLQDSVSGDFLDAAAVAATLFDDHGNADPVLNNIDMVYQAGTNGVYIGIVPATFQIALPVPQSGYSLQITATQGSAQAQWTIPVHVRARTS